MEKPDNDEDKAALHGVVDALCTARDPSDPERICFRVMEAKRVEARGDVQDAFRRLAGENV